MRTIAEIEKAIEKLPPKQVDELASWLEDFRKKRAVPQSVESWLQGARGAAVSGTTTSSVMTNSRGDELNQ